MHPYLAVILLALAATLGGGALLVAVTELPPRDPDASDLRPICAIVAAVATLSAVATILLTVDL